MFDIFTWIFATILHCTSPASPMLIAQETQTVENASAQQPEASAQLAPGSDLNVEKSTLEELMKLFGQHETAYFPFHIQSQNEWPPSNETSHDTAFSQIQSLPGAVVEYAQHRDYIFLLRTAGPRI